VFQKDLPNPQSCRSTRGATSRTICCAGICPERTSNSGGSLSHRGQGAKHNAHLESAEERERPTCVGTEDQRELGDPVTQLRKHQHHHNGNGYCQGYRQYREYDRGRQFGTGLRVGYGSWDIASNPGTHYRLGHSSGGFRFTASASCDIAICFGDPASATAGGTVLAASGPSDKFPCDTIAGFVEF